MSDYEKGTVERIAEDAAKATKKSKYGIVNTMNIEQLRRAKKVLEGKKNGKYSSETKAKMEEMLGEYERAERQIAKYYQTVTRHSQGAALLAGRGRTLNNLTIQNIKGLKSINSKDMGKLSSGAGKVVALTAGIGMIAAGAGMLGTDEVFAWKLIFDLIANSSTKNKVAMALIAAGAATLGGVAIAKKIKKNKAAKDKAQADVNAAENEAFEEAMKTEGAIENTVMGQEQIENLANEISKNPDLAGHYMQIVSTGVDQNGNQYTQAQRISFAKALSRSREMENELQAEIDKYNGVESTTSESESEVGDYTDTSKPKPKPKKEVPAAVAALETELSGLLVVATSGAGGGVTKADAEASFNNLQAFIDKVNSSSLTPDQKEKLIKKAKARQASLTTTTKGTDGKEVTKFKYGAQVKSAEDFERGYTG